MTPGIKQQNIPQIAKITENTEINFYNRNRRLLYVIRSVIDSSVTFEALVEIESKRKCH